MAQLDGVGMNTEWRPIVGFEGLYSVSNLGQVWSFFGAGRVLRPAAQKPWGHLHVQLYKGGVPETYSVHRLVARAFIGEPTGPLVRHIDGRSANNNASNLAYGTPSENSFDTVRHGHNLHSNQVACINGHLYTDENTYNAPGRYRRDCRTCIRARVKKYKASKRALA
ncbi:HNH endonuclease [Cryobacterium sp. Y57]|uniref:HNH endonuclease n=1 Tax=Cryobacterium sp. Y57 TaxID=2048287 RepID=UPI000CE2C9F2